VLFKTIIFSLSTFASCTEALDMILILGEFGGQFRTAERLWREQYPNHTPHSCHVFSRLAKQIANC